MRIGPRSRIAHVAGPTATIQNTPPLVTSNKARLKHGLPLRTGADGSAPRFDALRLQRIAAPAKVYVEQFSAHPLEADASELYGPPDGYLNAGGEFSADEKPGFDKPVYEILLLPEDGLYPLPYMARQADGSAWDAASPTPSTGGFRQTFFPDGSRSFEEIDRMQVGRDGTVNEISSRAEIDFYRSVPPGGYMAGLAHERRGDLGDGDIPTEIINRDFFAYSPQHVATLPPRPVLAKATNDMQAILAGGRYDGAIWTHGSPQMEEMAYWFNLLVDTALPICCTAAQRPHGQTGADGPKNLIDCVSFIRSAAWKDAEGRNRCGVIAVQEQQFIAAREVYKSDARPGSYRASGGHGGIIGQISYDDRVTLTYVPVFKHTYLSDVNITRLPDATHAVARGPDGIRSVRVRIKDAGKLVAEAIPSVSIIKDGAFSAEEFGSGADEEIALQAAIDHKLRLNRLAGFVSEGLVGIGCQSSTGRDQLLERAVFSGIPVVRVSRGTPEGFVGTSPYAIAGSNLTSIKARLLLMAALMKLGSLPVAKDPAHPTDAERRAARDAIAAYQDIFWMH